MRNMNTGYQYNQKRRDIMVTSNIKATFPTTIENIWEIVTSLSNYSWRSDITKIEIINDIQFREYSKTGFATTFTVIGRDCLYTVSPFSSVPAG